LICKGLLTALGGKRNGRDTNVSAPLLLMLHVAP
jgi:hypothetical protein